MLKMNDLSDNRQSVLFHHRIILENLHSDFLCIPKVCCIYLLQLTTLGSFPFSAFALKNCNVIYRKIFYQIQLIHHFQSICRNSSRNITIGNCKTWLECVASRTVKSKAATAGFLRFYLHLRHQSHVNWSSVS